MNDLDLRLALIRLYWRGVCRGLLLAAELVFAVIGLTAIGWALLWWFAP